MKVFRDNLRSDVLKKQNKGLLLICVVICSGLSNNLFAWDAKKRLTYFESVRQESAICGKEKDLFFNFTKTVKKEYGESIKYILNEGKLHGLSEEESKLYLVQVAEKIESDVRKEHVPYVIKNRREICGSITERLNMIFGLIKQE